MRTKLASLNNLAQSLKNAGGYSYSVHRNPPSGFSISSTGAPNGIGVSMSWASKHLVSSPTTEKIGTATTFGKPRRPNEVRQHERLRASS